MKKTKTCMLKTIKLEKKQTSAGNPKAGKLKIAYFCWSGKNGEHKAWPWLVERVQDEFYLEQVDGQDIRNGVLIKNGFDVLVIPGGMAPRHHEHLKIAGRKQILQFVEQGGGYIGFCAGAYLACGTSPNDEYEPANWNYGLIRAAIKDLDHWNRGSGDHCEVEFSTLGQQIINNGQDKKAGSIYRYANGPLFELLDESLDPKAGAPIVFATFQTEFTKNDAPKGVMIGTPAIVGGTYGKGRVIACSPHPEKSQLKYAKDLKNMLLWAGSKLN